MIGKFLQSLLVVLSVVIFFISTLIQLNNFSNIAKCQKNIYLDLKKTNNLTHNLLSMLEKFKDVSTKMKNMNTKLEDIIHSIEEANFNFHKIINTQYKSTKFMDELNKSIEDVNNKLSVVDIKIREGGKNIDSTKDKIKEVDKHLNNLIKYMEENKTLIDEINSLF